MDIELIELQLFDEMNDVVKKSDNGEKPDFTKVNYMMEQIIHGAESCREMIHNRDKLTDEKFYRMLKEFAFISNWDEYDCYNVLEFVYNRKFVGEDIIKTTMHGIFQTSEGHGKDLSWWQEEDRIDLKIIYTEEFEPDYEHAYTVGEIKKLIADKKIVIVDQYERTPDDTVYEKEEYVIFEPAYHNIKHDFLDENGKYFLYTLKYIKSEVTSGELRKLFFQNMENVYMQVTDATVVSCYGSKSWISTAREYAKEFEARGYARRYEKLNQESKMKIKH